MSLADELRGLMERATPGEHVLDERPGVRYSVNVGSRHVALFSYYKEKQSDEDENIANTKLYILLRNNLPAILEALGEQEKRHVAGDSPEPTPQVQAASSFERLVDAYKECLQIVREANGLLQAEELIYKRVKKHETSRLS